MSVDNLAGVYDLEHFVNNLDGWQAGDNRNRYFHSALTDKDLLLEKENASNKFQALFFHSSVLTG